MGVEFTAPTEPYHRAMKPDGSTHGEAEPLPSPAERTTTVFGRWERRIAREVRNQTHGRIENFFEYWEEGAFEDGWELGKARQVVVQEMHDLSTEHWELSQTFLGAYLVSTDWLYKRCSVLRPGKVGGNVVDVLSELLVQAQGVAGEIACLIEHGHPVGAVARWRTLYELAVCAAFVHKHGERAAQRYKSVHIVQAFQDLEPIADRLTSPEQLRAWAQLQRRYRQVEAKYGSMGRNRGMYWWAQPFLAGNKGRPGIQQLAQVVGEPLSDYAYEYKKASHHIHADRRSSVLALRKSPGQGLRPASGGFVDVVYATVECLELIAMRLASRTSRATGDRRPLYWAYLTHMISLDVKTESFRDGGDVDPGYLSRELGLG